MIPYLILGIALVGSIFASYSDIKKREVSNWLSFGMIFSILALRILYGFLYKEYFDLMISLLAGALFFVIGIAFFYSGQWGGADLKILTAFGIGFGTLFEEFTPMFISLWPFFLTFLINFFMVALVYSLAYAFIMGLRNKKVLSDFKGSLNRYEQIAGMVIGLIAILLGVYKRIFLLVILIPLLWFLFKFLKPVEKHCMYKVTNVKDLVEFDVPEKDVVVDGETIVDSNNPDGMTLEQVKKIQDFVKKGKLSKTLKVKWGAPLIPVFPISLILSVTIGDLMFVLLSFVLI